MGLLIDLNRAQKPDLVAIPGIGPVLAERLITHRESVGGFSKIEDLAAVRGIGKKKLAAIYPFVKVTSSGRSRVAGCPDLAVSPSTSSGHPRGPLPTRCALP
ncbi:MAG: helix-hairpin-helix domain-containing protein [Thermodesulfobacteriota bacterium]